MKVNYLHDKEFKIMVIKMFTNLGCKMDEHVRASTKREKT